MATYETNAKVNIVVNGRQAGQVTDMLEKKIGRLRAQIVKAQQAGDSVKLKKLHSELRSAENLLNKMRSTTAEVSTTLSRLDRATPKQLNEALRALNRQLQNIQRGTAAWDAHVAKIRAVKAELAKVNATMATQKSLWERMNIALNNMQTFMFGAIAAVTGLVMAGRRAVSAYAQMEEEMANTRKYTQMSREDVERLNEAFKAMNTRIPRQELNQLAQEAGRLGKNTLESVQGYVEAAAVIKVALVDLGEGATQTIAKISNIFGVEELYGVRDAMLKVGSTVNVLSQNCTASKPFIVEFTQRMAGIGAQARMTIPEIMAFAATLDANGQKVEMSASALSRLVMKLFQDPADIAQKVGLDIEKFTLVLNNSTTKGVMMFLEQLNKIGDKNALAALSPLFKDMGMDGVRLAQVLANLSGHLDMVRWQMGEANKAFRQGSSASREYAIFNNTAQASIEKAKKRVAELAVELGERLYPAMKHIYTSSSLFLRVLKGVIDFIVEYRTTIMTLVTALTAYYTIKWLIWLRTKAMLATEVLLRHAYVLHNKILAGLSNAYQRLRGNILYAADAMKTMNATSKANVWTAVISVLAGVAYAVYQLATRVDEYKKKVDDAVRAVAAFDEQAVKEQHELDVLFGKLDAASQGTKEYEEAKNTIISQYGRYLNGLIDEKGEIIDLAVAYDTLSAAVKRSAQERGIKAAADQLNEDFYKDMSDALTGLQKLLEYYGVEAREAASLVSKISGPVISGKPLDDATRKRIDEISNTRPTGGKDASLWESWLAYYRSSKFKQWFGEDVKAPSEMVNRMQDMYAYFKDGEKRIQEMKDEVNPYNSIDDKLLERAIESLETLIASGQPGRALVYRKENPGTMTARSMTVLEAQEYLEWLQREQRIRGKGGEEPEKEPWHAPYRYDSDDGDGDGAKGKKPDRFAAENDYRAMRQAYAMLNRAAGQKIIVVDAEGQQTWKRRKMERPESVPYGEAEYDREMAEIDAGYYKRILEREDLTWLERLQMQAKYEDAMRNARLKANARTETDENACYQENMAAIKQSYADGIMTTEQYNERIESENLRHLEVLRDIARREAMAKKEAWEQRREVAEAELRDMKVDGNVDLLNRPVISGQKLVNAGWRDPQLKPESTATLYSSGYGVTDGSGAEREVLVTPILADGSVLSPEALDEYVREVLGGADDILAADSEGYGIVIGIDLDDSVAGRLHELHADMFSIPPEFDDQLLNAFLTAENNYLQAVTTAEERRRKEREKEQAQHQRELDGTKTEYFGDNVNDRRAKYDAEIALLDEVYASELDAVKDNADEKLRVEEAYQLARLAIAQKYGFAEEEGFKGAIAKSIEWLNSDGGKAVTGTVNTLAKGMSDIFSQVTAGIQADLEMQTAALEKRYDREISLAEGNSYKIKKLERQREKELAKVKSEANRKMFAMQVIQAVAQTATNALNAYGSAAAIPIVGHILAPIAAAMAVAAGMLQVNAIKKQQQASEAQGYASGGFTPSGRRDEAVGVVHAGEWVASQRLVNDPKVRPLLQALDYAQRTNTVGSLTQSAVTTLQSPVGAKTIAEAVAPRPAAWADDRLKTQVIMHRDPELVSVIKELKSRLSEPFVTVNTVTGDHGIQKAQDDYARLMANKTPKSRRK